MNFFRTWLRRALNLVGIGKTADSSPPAPIGHNRPPKSKRRTDGGWGEYYYLDDLLDNLDDYFETIRVLRRMHPDVYDLYSLAGAQSFNAKEGSSRFEALLPARWRSGGRPAFGAVHVNFAGEEGFSFACFQKIRRREHVQVAKGDLYEITLLWRDKEDPKGPKFCDQFWVDVQADGTVKLLKVFVVPRAGIPSRRWVYPACIQAMFKEANERGADGVEPTIEKYADFLFRIIAGAIENSQGGFQVRVRDQRIAAIFNIDMLRTPYFFKGRDKTINENGNSKRIFHIVGAHARRLAGGRTKYIKTHFRGERRFTWNGYRVTVSVPGLHHPIWAELEAETAYPEDITPSEGSMSFKQLGKLVGEFFYADRPK